MRNKCPICKTKLYSVYLRDAEQKFTMLNKFRYCVKDDRIFIVTVSPIDSKRKMSSSSA
jgi:hypothetical protein